MIRLAIIGFGGMGEVHANCFKKMNDFVKVVAIADLRKERREAAVKLLDAVKAYETGDELLDNADIDAVDVCLPTFLHSEYAIKAMEKGYPVFVEKPVCLNADEGKKMLEVQKRTGAKVMVGHVIRFWKEYVWLKEAKESGLYGELISATFTRMCCNPRWAWENWFNNFDRSGTEGLDLHIHDLDFVRYLMGEDSVPESTSIASRDKNGAISGMITLLKYPNTAICAESSWICADTFPFRMNFCARFEKATVLFEQNELTVFPMEGEAFHPEICKSVTDSDSEKQIINLKGEDAYYEELHYFAECVFRKKEPDISTLCESVKSVMAAEKEIERAGGKKI